MLASYSDLFGKIIIPHYTIFLQKMKGGCRNIYKKLLTFSKSVIIYIFIFKGLEMIPKIKTDGFGQQSEHSVSQGV